MSEHKELFDLLPEDARPKSLFPSDPCEGDEYWWDGHDPVDDNNARAIIEHAAMVWLIGMGWNLSADFGGDYCVYPESRSDWHGDLHGPCLVSCLLAAVRKEVGDD